MRDRVQEAKEEGIKTRNMVMHTKIGTYGAIRYGKIFYKVIRI